MVQPQMTISLKSAGLEEVTLAFGPHASGNAEFFRPQQVPAETLAVTYQTSPPVPAHYGAPIVEEIKVRSVKPLEQPTEFQVVHRHEDLQEEILRVIIQDLVPVTK